MALAQVPTRQLPEAEFRVQVAAVAAQQAALIEEECRLKQQQTTLTQQQEQLASHLDEKRQRVLLLADQVQTARVALQRERQDHANAWAKQAEELTRGKKELEDNRTKLQAERQRIRLLRRRLKQHFQRSFEAERQQLRQREAAVNDQHRRIEREAEKLQKDRDVLKRDRLALNGDIELAKRQLQSDRQQFKQEQERWNDERARKVADFATRAGKLRQREGALADGERLFGDAQHQWKLKSKHAEQEALGLENRIANLRRTLNEMKQQRVDRQSDVGSSKCEVRQPDFGHRTSDLRLGCHSTSTNHRPPYTIQDIAIKLDRAADDVADQRMELAEHWQRLAQTQLEWEQARDRAAYQMEALASDLPAKEQAILAKQEALHAAEAALLKRRQEAARFRQHLEGWAARIRLQETTWHCERDHLLADVRGREETAEKHLRGLVELRQAWAKRRRQEIDSLQAERVACEKLRNECAALRQECWKRSLSLAQQERELSEKSLALEESRQQFILQSQDAAAAESRLERIRKRWVQDNAPAMQTLAEQLERLQTEASQIQQRGRELLKIAEELTAREARLTQRQTAWEETLTIAEADKRSLHQHLQTAHVQRQRSQRQIAELQAEVERLARMLLDSADESAAPSAEAA